MNGTTTEYLTSGGEVVAQKTGSNVTTYTRGADGSLISMNRNGTVYYYQTNLQGDVEKILDGSGTAVVAYTYDAYGRITSMTGDQSLGQENPFRYRSYFFDQESGFYYLQSRYYDPMMGRFISADSQINPDVNGGNVFAYCSNNPVKNIDPQGNFFLAGILLPAISLAIGIAATLMALKANYDMNSSSEESSAPPTDPYIGGDVTEDPIMPRYVSQLDGKAGHNEDEWDLMNKKLQGEGCAVASAVMALSFLHITMTPNQLYTLNGKSVVMNWRNAWGSIYGPTSGYFSTADIDASLQRYIDNPEIYAPPILRVRPEPNSHFAVIISGKDGQYTAWDPATGEGVSINLQSSDRLIQYYFE